MVVNWRQLKGVFAANPESVTSRFYLQKPPSKAKNPVEISLNIHKFNRLSWSDPILPSAWLLLSAPGRGGGPVAGGGAGGAATGKEGIRRWPPRAGAAGNSWSSTLQEQEDDAG